MNLLSFALLAALAGGPVMAAAVDSIPPGGVITFDVMRNGKDIGDQVIRFDRTGDTVQVSVETDVKVKVPVIGVSAYVFRQSSQETWQGNKLTALKSKTDNNGKDAAITLGASPLVPASLWNAEIVKATQILNTIDGTTMAVAVQNLGPDTVQTGHGAVPATHYRLTGGLERDLWFDAGHRLVHVALTADDGSRVDYVLR